MTETIFRRATSADVPAIVKLLGDDVLGRTREDIREPPNPKYAAAFAAIDADGNQFLAVAERAGAIVGCLQISFIPGLSKIGMWRGQIESVRISADHRGGGLGRKMIEWAIAECRRRGCGTVQLTTDKSRLDAQRFYSSLGFAASHEGMKLELK
ncbi:MAG: GNAT family N-acetyltransferase [Telmatospirillum sp.]|nr:GNAT family N-acetyltransferase [Telmatospirillum sp.]